ncbi:MAG: endonuclease/exonuclease/phosphatase family protein, partial [Usitatibacter sp.]
MKLITWNIQWGRGVDGRVDLERIVRKARSLADFDVLCMQEVADNFPAPWREGNDDRDQFAAFAALLPEYRCVAGYGMDIAGTDGRRRRFGNVIFSRYSVLAVRRHALPWPADRDRRATPRVAVEATLRAPMGPVRVTTAHLEYYSEVQRRAQSVRLRNLHDEACQRAVQPPPGVRDGSPFDAPAQTVDAILVGDFNFPPEHPAYADLQSPLAGNGPRYRDAWVLLNGRQPHTPTFRVHSPQH